MMPRTTFGSVALFLLLFFSSVSSASWQIVTHRDSELSSLQLAEVRHLFTEGLVQGKSPQLIDLSDEVLRAQFYETVLSMSQNRWRAHWAKRVFTGSRQLPKQLAIDYVTHYLDTNPNAVAYLPDDMLLPATLKVLYCSSAYGSISEVSACHAALEAMKSAR